MNKHPQDLMVSEEKILNTNSQNKRKYNIQEQNFCTLKKWIAAYEIQIIFVSYVLQLLRFNFTICPVYGI